ncbi:hypothetical protein [Actinoplanes sp. NPDC051494]|uniref:hypothetical protein n=1 Tax=Actinoplanes sp. NPDC051494 TaxID=3363907 RepID=UPI003790DC65
MYRYMVAWLDVDGLRIQHGNADMNWPRPIADMNDVNGIQQALAQKYHLHQPILMGFSRFEEDQ